jgi:hypothetical protein
VGERIIITLKRLAAFCVALGAFASGFVHAQGKPQPPVPWNKVPEQERKALAPIAKDWDQLSGTQQRKLVGAAKEFPKLAPIQQERFQERIKDWSSLSPEQRKTARDKYENLSKLPPEKQHSLRERWNERNATSTSNTPADQQPTAK